ncbi:hypothetical protein BU23DRAFT_637256 [Bimuria novae-zelandiae CBS 107.79]|uniref:Uncharacterized protein n=1 Tax=Bimuria novae-zelandiae CBS 107.79 TaxID=1447943 RepID=A0A6A5VTE4_9PLEO|nr:hypothetical protein BU23DRAFT_637256 [Bimuria novae-zelandiae CBS 107.79]
MCTRANAVGSTIALDEAMTDRTEIAYVAPAEKAPFRLFDLPPELRNRIYLFAIINDSGRRVVLCIGAPDAKKCSLNILTPRKEGTKTITALTNVNHIAKVSRQMRKEVLGLVEEHNEVRFLDGLSAGCAGFARYIENESCAQRLRRVVITERDLIQERISKLFTILTFCAAHEKAQVTFYLPHWRYMPATRDFLSFVYDGIFLLFVFAGIDETALVRPNETLDERVTHYKAEYRRTVGVRNIVKFHQAVSRAPNFILRALHASFDRDAYVKTATEYFSLPVHTNDPRACPKPARIRLWAEVMSSWREEGISGGAEDEREVKKKVCVRVMIM